MYFFLVLFCSVWSGRAYTTIGVPVMRAQLVGVKGRGIKTEPSNTWMHITLVIILVQNNCKILIIPHPILWSIHKRMKQNLKE